MSKRWKVKMHDDLKTTLEKIVAQVKDANALIYAEAWLDGVVARTALESGLPIENAEDMQASYLLGNLAGWKGKDAREGKVILKSIEKGEPTFMSKLVPVEN